VESDRWIAGIDDKKLSNEPAPDIAYCDDGGDPPRETAYLGLGASLGDRLSRLQEAVDRLQGDGTDLEVVQVSPVYESPHLGIDPGDERRYPPHLNAVLQVRTSLSPLELLERAQAVEEAGGRQRELRWGPRTIDVDLLLYAHRIVHTERLTLPHPELARRAFVVTPLLDLAPALRLPDGTSLATLAQAETIRAQKIELFGANLRLP
jgi:2-amino-4-hydroxy-6-hydroxymethyldihydropteridine diphosphokinase